MKQLCNALAFAAVVIAAFVMDSNLPQRVVSSPLTARVVHVFRGEQLPVVASLGELPEAQSPDIMPPMPPDFDQAKLDRAVARMQSAQQVLSRVEMRRMEAQVRRAQQRLAVKTCKVVKLDQ